MGGIIRSFFQKVFFGPRVHNIVIYEARTLLLNGVSVSKTRSGHRHSYDTHETRISEVSNSKNICRFLTILVRV